MWVDACAAGSAGLTVLVLHEWVAQLHAFPRSLVLFIALTNLAYGSYSFSLATRASSATPPSRRAIDVLIIANLSWVAVCASMLAFMVDSASVFGLAHLVLEGVFVGVLGLVERRWVRPFAR